MLTRRTALGLLAVARPLAAWQSYYYGKDEPLPRSIELAAGDLTLVFEPELAFVRYLRYGDAEVIRGIYAAVRDRNWGTVAPQVSKLRVETTEGAFRVSFDVTCKEGPIDFLWHGEIIGEASSKVTFRMEGEARSTFLRNRVGFCVLHPVKECAGKPCSVKHSSGSTESGKFPLQVSPDQPFKDMAAVSHEIAPGVAAEVIFNGETFEMEDHRNWTDASYKTYCTPLEKPYPVEVKQGSKITQSVTVALTGAKPAATKRFTIRRPELTIEVDKSAQPRSLPRMGLGMALEQPALNPAEARRIAALKPSHLRLDLKPSDTKLLDRAIKESGAVGVPLEIALHLSDNAEAELKALAPLARKARVARWIIFHQKEKSTNAKWVALAKKAFPGASVGGGTNAYFAELNRGRPDMAALDFVSFSVNPQVHAFDNASLVENLAAQADAVNSARQFAGRKGIVISPVTFKPRFNPNATGEVALAPDTLPPQIDPRQMSLFGAAWTLGSIKYLAESGAQSITYFETSGPRGVLESVEGPKWGKLFPSRSNQVFPLYHVLASVNEMAGGEVLSCRSNQPLLLDGLVLRKGTKIRAMVANMSPEAQAVKIAWPSTTQSIRITKLDADQLKHATDSPETWRMLTGDTIVLTGVDVEFSLGPYAVARLDTVDV